MTTEPDRNVYWRNALNGVMGRIINDDPQCGYYKMKVSPKRIETLGRPYYACAIWWDGGKIVATRQIGPLTTEQKKELADRGDFYVEPNAMWTYVAQRPISEEQFLAITVDGARWPDEVEPVAKIGHNNPPEPINVDDPIRQTVEKAEQLMKLEKLSNDDAAKLRTVQERLRGLRKKRENERVDAIAPHLEAQREINAKFGPIILEMDRANETISAVLTTYLRFEQAKLDAEHAAKVKAAAAEQQALAEAGHTEEAELVTVPKEAPKARIEGAGGKAASIRTTKSAKIDDYGKALAALADREEVKALVQQLCDRAARAGHPIDGTTIVTSGKAV